MKFSPLLLQNAGVLLRRLSVRARDRRHPVAEGGRQEVMEEALLPPQGFRNLLRPQRQSQGGLRVRTTGLGAGD